MRDIATEPVDIKRIIENIINDSINNRTLIK